jgi:uncharacterized membrane protein
MDQLVNLILILLAIAVLVSAIVMPIVAVIISLNSRKRLAELEARIHRLEATLATETPPEPETAAPPAVATSSSFSAHQIESTIGRRWVGWIAILLILFATAFFLKYAFDNRWIGELGRVAIGVMFGIGMCLAGHRYHRRGWRVFSQMLTAGGIVLLYLSTYAAFAYYDLIGQKMAFVFFVVLIVETGVLALIYKAPAIAIMALIGGFLNPILLRSDQDQYRSLFAYIVALDVGALALLKQWRGLSTIAYFGTQFLFWVWYAENYQPEKRAAVLVFHTVVFVIFLVAHLIRDLVRREPATTEYALLLLINPFVFYATTYYLLNPTHHDWMGVFAIGMALLYAALGKFLHERSFQDRRERLLFITAALTFVTIAIPIQLDGNWVTVAWAVQGLAILWGALKLQSMRMRTHAFVLFGLTFVRLMLWDTPYGWRPAFIPVFNKYFLSSLAVIACFAVAAYVYQRAVEKKLVASQLPRLILGLMAAIAFWFVLSMETRTFFNARARDETVPEDASHQRWLGQMALSVVWATYAGVLAAIGFVRRAAPLRWASLALFALTVVKAMLIDIAELHRFYRIIVFFVLGVLLLLVARAYHKAFHSRSEPQEGTQGTKIICVFCASLWLIHCLK